MNYYNVYVYGELYRTKFNELMVKKITVKYVPALSTLIGI